MKIKILYREHVWEVTQMFLTEPQKGNIIRYGGLMYTIVIVIHDLDLKTTILRVVKSDKNLRY